MEGIEWSRLVAIFWCAWEPRSWSAGLESRNHSSSQKLDQFSMLACGPFDFAVLLLKSPSEDCKLPWCQCQNGLTRTGSEKSSHLWAMKRLCNSTACPRRRGCSCNCSEGRPIQCETSCLWALSLAAVATIRFDLEEKHVGSLPTSAELVQRIEFQANSKWLRNWRKTSKEGWPPSSRRKPPC